MGNYLYSPFTAFPSPLCNLAIDEFITLPRELHLEIRRWLTRVARIRLRRTCWTLEKLDVISMAFYRDMSPYSVAQQRWAAFLGERLEVELPHFGGFDIWNYPAEHFYKLVSGAPVGKERPVYTAELCWWNEPRSHWQRVYIYLLGHGKHAIWVVHEGGHLTGEGHGYAQVDGLWSMPELLNEDTCLNGQWPSVEDMKQRCRLYVGS